MWLTTNWFLGYGSSHGKNAPCDEILQSDVIIVDFVNRVNQFWSNIAENKMWHNDSLDMLSF